jgi:hypothetical protein
MWIRYNKSTRRIIHRSVPGFTVPVTRSEADAEVSDDLSLHNENPDFLRLTEDLSEVEYDPVLKPKEYSWTGPDKAGTEKVTSAEKVDKVTAMRIRKFISNTGPMDEQLKHLRLVAFALDVKRDPSSYGAEEMAQANDIITESRGLNSQVEEIRKQGKAFKAEQGW